MQTLAFFIISHMHETEIWKPVLGYEGLYEVSSIGNVRSVPRVDSLGHFRGGFYMKLNQHKDGHVRVSLCKNGVIRPMFVHRIMLASFTGYYGPEARHMNGIPTDNRIENLAWGTRRDNAQDCVRHGRQPTGETSPVSKLSNSDVEYILTSGKSIPELKSRLGVHNTCIHSILKGRTWRHIRPDIQRPVTPAKSTPDQSGTKNGNSKLNENDVKMIRSSKLAHFELAALLGVSSTAIYSIRTHKAWKHVT